MIPPSRYTIAQEVYETVLTGLDGAGVTVAIIGPSGIGKTFLWQSVASVVSRDYNDPVYYKAPQGQALPLEPLRYIINSFVARTVDTESIERSDILARAADDAGIPPHVRYHLLGFLAREVRSDYSVDGLPSIPDLVEHFVLLVRSLIASRPTTIVVDDVQWIDPVSLEILNRLTGTADPVSVVLIGRLEALALPTIETVRHRWTIEPLTREESTRLLAASVRTKKGYAPPREFTEWALSWAQGNPFDLIEAGRLLKQHDRFEQYILSEENGSGESDVPAAEAAIAPDQMSARRILDLPPISRRLVQIVALTAVPIKASRLAAIPGLSAEERNAALSIAVDHGVLVEDSVDGSISFTHDRLEYAARHSVDDHHVVSEAAAAMLKAAVTAGKRDASYTLARYLTAAMESPAPDSGVRPGLWREPDTPEGSTDNARTVARMISESIPVPQRLAILEASARQMLETFAPTEALRFVNTADTILERYASEATSFSPLLLYDYGHTAAFLTGDGVRMSRYFTRLHGRVDRLTLNRLRELWVTRCSDRMWIAGAWRIGRIILADLGAIPTGSNEIAQATVDARKALTHRFLRHVGRQIRRSSASATRSASNGDSNHGNREDQIIGRTAIRVLLPTLSVAPDTASLFAWIILKDFDRYSAPPVTLLGLVYWSMALRSNTRQRKMIRTIRRLGEALMATLKNSTETWSEHTAMALVYGEILFTEWQRDTDGVEQRLFEMYSRGLAAGSPDAAAHSISLYCQWLFLRGFPLDDVYATMDHYRTETAALGHTRTATSIAKYQQAAEVLLGRTSVPDRLTGSLIQDEEIERGLRVTKDTLALFGYYILRVFIGVYHNAPNVAYQAFQPLIDGLDRVSRFFDINAVHFYYGIATSQLNLVDELRGQIAALARRRREPAGQHRYLALRAEHAYHRGHRYLARRRFRRAADLAVLRGFPSEAAIIAERDGTINGNIERLALAAGLYRRWGASRAEERVSAEMARLRRPPEGYIAFRSSRSPVQDGAEVPDAVLRRTRSYFHLLLATIPDALLLINTEGLVLLRNGAAESYVVRGSRDEEHLAPPYDRTILPLIQQTITDRTHLHAEREIAGQLVELTVSPAAFRPEGNAEGDRDTGEAAVVVRDITTLREREQQLILADRMTSLGMLASTVAHEVSNPNHIVQLNAQVLQLYLDGDATRSPGNEAAIREAVHNVLEGARRIDGVVRRVVDYGRGGAEQRWASIDPIELCNRVISFTRLLVTRSNEGIVFTRYEPLPPTTAVASLIEQALINLVKNAVEAVGANGGEIALSVDARDRWLVFSVCDQGPGIEATITDPTKAFVTSRSEQGGGGLGLSIVRSIAEKHGGRLVFARDGRYNTVANLLIPHDYGVSGESVASNRSVAE